MENLTQCSQTLYDKDIIDKMNEITYLKKKINSEILPKVHFSNWEEWVKKKTEAYKIIKDSVHKYVVEDEFEYAYMEYQGLTIRQRMYIREDIDDALKLLTKNEDWSMGKSWQIIYGIEGFFYGFINTGIWNNIYSTLEAQQLADIIYNNIEWQLGNDSHSPNILEDIPQITCERCNNITNESYCSECDIEKPSSVGSDYDIEEDDSDELDDDVKEDESD